MFIFKETLAWTIDELLPVLAASNFQTTNLEGWSEKSSKISNFNAWNRKENNFVWGSSVEASKI